MEYNFLTHMVEEPMRGDGLLKPHTYNQGRTHKDQGQPLLQDPKMVEFRIPEGRSKAKSGITALDFSTEIRAGEIFFVAY